MNMQIMVMLFGWPLLSLALFLFAPPRRAILISVIGGYLILPQAGMQFGGLPDYDRNTAIVLGSLIGVVLFDTSKLFAFRFRWIDVPATLACVAPFFSSVANGLGVYDGVSNMWYQWMLIGTAYFLGRLYFNTPQAIRELAIALIMAGFFLSALILFEVRMSPQLHQTLYGYHPNSWRQTVHRWFGYRPWVFFSSGIEMGMWLASVVVLAYWMWLVGKVKYITWIPMGFIVGVLTFTLLVCNAANAWIVCSIVAMSYFVMRTFHSRIAFVLLLVAVAAYCPIRITGLVPVELAQNLSAINKDRTISLMTRLVTEDIFVEHAMKSPVFGWGGYSRNRPDVERVTLPGGVSRSVVTDSWWIILLGKYGLVGLFSVVIMLLLPMAMALRRLPIQAWKHPNFAPVIGLAILVTCFSINALYNARFGPVYFIPLGAVLGHFVYLAQFQKQVQLAHARQRRAARVASSQPVQPIFASR